MHEGTRFPDANAIGLERLVGESGLLRIIVESIEVKIHFSDFDDYWQTFLGGQGPASTYLPMPQAKRSINYYTIPTQ